VTGPFQHVVDAKRMSYQRCTIKECVLILCRNFTECIYIPQKHCRAVQLAAQAPDIGYTGISLSPLFEPYPIPRRWYMPRLLQNCTSPALDAHPSSDVGILQSLTG
jgi:hypothetical protein